MQSKYGGQGEWSSIAGFDNAADSDMLCKHSLQAPYKNPVVLDLSSFSTGRSVCNSMYYSKNIRSRAGLVALIFALIISLVSAVPIPATESGLSSTTTPSLNGHDQLDIAKISSNGRVSTLPAAPRSFTRKVRYFVFV